MSDRSPVADGYVDCEGRALAASETLLIGLAPWSLGDVAEFDLYVCFSWSSVRRGIGVWFVCGRVAGGFRVTVLSRP